MKKTLLFIMNDLSCGGAEKALVSLLNTLDYNLFDVDLFLFKKEGLFLNQVPKEVNILPIPINYPYFDMSMGKAISKNLKTVNFKVIIYRLLVGYIYKTNNIKAIAEQKSWKYLSKVIEPIKLEIIKRIFNIIEDLTDNENIIITGSFLDKGFHFNDIDVVIISIKK